MEYGTYGPKPIRIKPGLTFNGQKPSFSLGHKQKLVFTFQSRF